MYFFYWTAAVYVLGRLKLRMRHKENGGEKAFPGHGTSSARETWAKRRLEIIERLLEDLLSFFVVVVSFKCSSPWHNFDCAPSFSVDVWWQRFTTIW